MLLPKRSVIPKIMLVQTVELVLLLNDAILNKSAQVVFILLLKTSMVQMFTCVLLSFIKISALYDITSCVLFVFSV